VAHALLLRSEEQTAHGCSITAVRIFRHHDAAIDFAKAIAHDMTHRISAQWLGWSVEVFDEGGRQFVSVPIGTAEAA
jgi:hypothetical protein